MARRPVAVAPADRGELELDHLRVNQRLQRRRGTLTFKPYHCALAPSAAVLIAARAVQGLGAAAILPSSLAIVNQLFPDPAERPRAIGIWAGLGGSALVLGPVLGGALAGPLGWRAIFWVNVPLVLGSLTGPRSPRSRRARGSMTATRSS